MKLYWFFYESKKRVKFDLDHDRVDQLTVENITISTFIFTYFQNDYILSLETFFPKI
jgi:hypothetical protein